MKKIITWMFVPVLLFVLIIPQGADANTAQSYKQNQAQINYLYTLIAQLQAQLNALEGAGISPASTKYLSVQTDGVSAQNRENIELEGQAVFKQDGDARVWFEYGQTKTLSYSSISLNLKNKDEGDRVTYAISIPDLDTNRMYYYRAVAEGEDGRYAEGIVKSFRYEGRSDNNNSNHNNNSSNNDNTPDVTTDEADNVDEDSVVLQGDVDMNDFEDAIAFFVYGEDEDLIDNVTDEDTYRDIEIDGSDLRKVQIASNVDTDRSFSLTVTGLNDDTEHFYRLCVQYENDDNDNTLACGDVESFETDQD